MPRWRCSINFDLLVGKFLTILLPSTNASGKGYMHMLVANAAFKLIKSVHSSKEIDCCSLSLQNVRGRYRMILTGQGTYVSGTATSDEVPGISVHYLATKLGLCRL